eukprot:5711691-Pleurochrysis_carterae.AAC.3
MANPVGRLIFQNSGYEPGIEIPGRVVRPPICVTPTSKRWQHIAKKGATSVKLGGLVDNAGRRSMCTRDGQQPGRGPLVRAGTSERAGA